MTYFTLEMETDRIEMNQIWKRKMEIIYLLLILLSSILFYPRAVLWVLSQKRPLSELPREPGWRSLLAAAGWWPAGEENIMMQYPILSYPMLSYPILC